MATIADQPLTKLKTRPGLNREARRHGPQSLTMRIAPPAKQSLSTLYPLSERPGLDGIKGNVAGTRCRIQLLIPLTCLEVFLFLQNGRCRGLERLGHSFIQPRWLLHSSKDGVLAVERADRSLCITIRLDDDKTLRNQFSRFTFCVPSDFGSPAAFKAVRLKTALSREYFLSS